MAARPADFKSAVSTIPPLARGPGGTDSTLGSYHMFLSSVKQPNDEVRWSDSGGWRRRSRTSSGPVPPLSAAHHFLCGGRSGGQSDPVSAAFAQWPALQVIQASIERLQGGVEAEHRVRLVSLQRRDLGPLFMDGREQ